MNIIYYRIFISNNVNTGSFTAISAHGQISGQKFDNTISSLSINRSMHEFLHNSTVVIPQPITITHIHINVVSVWEVNFVLFNSMLEYVINRLMHAFFSHFRTVIIPSGRYRSFVMITVLKWKGHTLSYNYIMCLHTKMM